MTIHAYLLFRNNVKHLDTYGRLSPVSVDEKKEYDTPLSAMS